MLNAPIENAVLDIEENPYYKKIRNELRQKAVKEAEMKPKETSVLQKVPNNQLLIPEDIFHSSAVQKEQKDTVIKEDSLRDSVQITAQELVDELNESKKASQEQDVKRQQLIDRMKYNGLEIMRNLAYKIDFSARKEEFKEMFKYNLQQSRSDNMFVSRFSQFKVGVVGQILTGIGIPIEELKKLKKQAFKEVFDENCLEMQENIYNIELVEIINGKKRRTKRSLKMFYELQMKLIKTMNNIGRVGYWSKSRLFEEKIKQCKRIRDEMSTEKAHLEYLLSYYGQD
jgi:hypothetical protein